MAENLIINGGNKRELYETLLPQLQSLTAGETDIIANMANVAAALKQTFDFFWVGFYIVKEEMLVLAPSRVLLPVRVSGTGKAYAGQPGKKYGRSSYRMWSSFRGISPVAPPRGRKLSYR